MNMTFHRIYMQGLSEAGTSMVLFLPLDADGRYQPGKPAPLLFRATHDGSHFYGELTIDGNEATFVWDPYVVEWTSPSDLVRVPIRLARRVRVEAFYNQATPEVFLVKHIAPL